MENYMIFIASGVVVVVIVVINVMMRRAQKQKDADEARASAKLKARADKRAAAAKQVKTIEWSERFVIDGGVIDNDHKTLFRLINNFNQSIPNFQSGNQMAPFIDALRKYTENHFKREELLQQKVAYSFIDDHKKEHADLIAELNERARKAMGADADTVTDAAMDLGSFLGDWLTDHVIETDLPMRAYVDRMREHAKGMGALEE